MHHMQYSGGSVVLMASTSGYFGGTGVAAYVTSKHGVIGLMRSSQITANKYGIRINAVAPFFTPTHITSSYADNWKDAGLEANTPEGVAAVIMQASLDDNRSGTCILVWSKDHPSSWLVVKTIANKCTTSRHVEVY